MPLFRRKADPKTPRTSSISIYGQGRIQALQKPRTNSKNADKQSDSSSISSFDLDDRPHPLAFAEATFDPALPIKTKSRLSKDLIEVLHENAALAYFIQFMDAQKAQHLVKFWLEAESFRISSETKQKLDATSSPAFPANELKASPSPSFPANKLEASTSPANEDIASSANDVFPSSSQNPVPKTNNNKDSKHYTVPGGREAVRMDGTDSVSFSPRTVQASSSVDSGCEVRSKCTEEEGSEGQMTITPGAQKSPVFGAQKSDLGEEDHGAEGPGKLATSTVEDAIAIFAKYIAPGAPYPIGISDDLIKTIGINLFKSSGDIDSQCFVPAQDLIVQKMDKDYYPNFLRSSFNCKHQIDVLTSGNVFLADVLYNDSALFFFMEFMEQEGVRHLVDFLLMADNFRKDLLSRKNSDGMECQADAMVIYDKYFSLQASIPLGFSDSVRFEVEANICQETGPNPDCFLKPVRILTQYLEKTFLLQFLSSQLYFKYISECIISIQNDGADSSSQSKYTGSDSGSEKSLPISSINTLLAMDSKQPGNPKFCKSLESLDSNIDSNQNKSEDLWERPAAGSKLQMARIDHLGRITTEFELPDCEKGKESKISKAVKKLVNWEEDKNQEEMAWKVAEMIVKDICSVTMPDSSSPFPSQKFPHDQQSW